VACDAGTRSCAVRVWSVADVERIRREGRTLASTVGFPPHEAEAVALAVSELATNLVRYAPAGELRVALVAREAGPGIAITSQDAGPGIDSVELATRDAYSSGGGLGGGLPAVRRLMDDFALTTGPKGTWIEAHKWLNTRSPSR